MSGSSRRISTRCSTGRAVDTPINVDKVHAGVLELWYAVQSQPSIGEAQVYPTKDLYNSAINSLSNKGPETELEGGSSPSRRPGCC